jgi:hypothetical protein
LTILDPLLNIEYQIGEEQVDCLDASDTDGNGEVNISDPATSLNYQFGVGPPPPAPYPACGLDPDYDSLDCVCSPACTGCKPIAGVGREPSKDATIRISLGRGQPYGSDRLRYGVVLENDIDLYGWEYTVDFTGSMLNFERLEAPGCDFASGKPDSASGHVRFGQIVSLGLSESLSAGIHEVAEIICTGRPGREDAIALVGGLYVDGEGGHGRIQVVSTPDPPGSDASPPSRRFSSYAVPNPFNPSVTIHYEIPRTAGTLVEIYDTSGRLVRVLEDRVVEAGKHQADWNGTTRDHAPAASGVYFYRIRSGVLEQTEKIVLLR